LIVSAKIRIFAKIQTYNHAVFAKTQRNKCSVFAKTQRNNEFWLCFGLCHRLLLSRDGAANRESHKHHNGKEEERLLAAYGCRFGEVGGIGNALLCRHNGGGDGSAHGSCDQLMATSF
jgi:hypothetical protein